MSDKPAESARPKVPTVEDTLRTLRKISHCSGDPAKLILMRNFAEAYADSVRAELERVRTALVRMLKAFTDQDGGLCIECGEVTGKRPGCDTCYVVSEAERALHPEGDK